MKLELVVLTTLISMITKRQVEAASHQLVCYANRNLNGVNVTITDNTPDVTSQIPNGIKSCIVSGSWIFYSEKQYFGDVNVFSSSGEVYYPRSRFNIKSLLRLGNQSHPEGVFLFQRVHFQGGLSQNFFSRTENVTGSSTFKSAAVIGSVEWSIVSKNPQKGSTCLRPNQFGASFIDNINSAGLGDTISILPGGCSGTNYTGYYRKPECPCNPHGTVDGPAKCEGTQGICQCKTGFTGDDCDQCPSSKTWRAGRCYEGCACDPAGVQGGDLSCWPSNSKDGWCNCIWFYGGRKCDRCANSAYRNNGSCSDCRCPILRVFDEGRVCNEYDGRCNCKSMYAGNECEHCASGHFKFNDVCLTQQQNQKAQRLQTFCDNQETDKNIIYGLITDMVNLGMFKYLDYLKTEVKSGKTQPHEAACRIVNAI